MLITNKKDRFKIQSISLPNKLIKQVDITTKYYQMTKSEMYRRAIELYIHKLNWDRLREYGAKKAAELGITNEDQVVELINDWRKDQKSKTK